MGGSVVLVVLAGPLLASAFARARSLACKIRSTPLRLASASRSSRLAILAWTSFRWSAQYLRSAAAAVRFAAAFLCSAGIDASCSRSSEMGDADVRA